MFARRMRGYRSSGVGMAMLSNRLTFCVEQSSGPVYFKIGESQGDNHDAIKAEKFYNVLSKGPIAYLSSFLRGVCFPKNIARHFELKKALSSRPELYYGLAFNTVDTFEHGFFVRLANESSSTTSFLQDVKKMELLGDSVNFTLCLRDGNAFAKPLDHESSQCLPITLVSPPSVHPAFIFNDTNAVYRDIERVYYVLNQFSMLEEVRELLSICNRYIQRTKHWKSLLPLKAKNSVIVIEGLDATGKTTLAKSLARKVNGPDMKSIPECIVHLRSKFDSHPELLRRAYYSISNYVFSEMICEESSRGVVVVDRFWNSTAAYAIAKEVNVGGANCLPPVGHDVYKWPPDLLRPDAVVLLTVSDEVRQQRLADRGSVKTDEEIHLEQSSNFRQRLEEAYMRMQKTDDSVMLHVDSSAPAEEVLNRTFELLRSRDLV